MSAVRKARTEPEAVTGNETETVRGTRLRSLTSRTVGRRAGTLHRKIHIVGGPGSGKTSLATQLTRRTGLPVHHLDNVARIGGGDGPLRSEAERTRLVEAILSEEGWITEGVHLLWTEPLLEQAEVIVWLDYVTWSKATSRIVKRFFTGAFREMRKQHGLRRFVRFRDYGHQLRTLGNAIVEARHYYGAPHKPAEAHTNQGAEDSTLGSWSATAAQLAPYEAKLVHCRSAAEVAAFTQGLR
jgi:hypothetical protein